MSLSCGSSKEKRRPPQAVAAREWHVLSNGNANANYSFVTPILISPTSTLDVCSLVKAARV